MEKNLEKESWSRRGNSNRKFLCLTFPYQSDYIYYLSIMQFAGARSILLKFFSCMHAQSIVFCGNGRLYRRTQLRYRGITALYFLHSGIPNAKDSQRASVWREGRVCRCYRARTALKSAYPGEQWKPSIRSRNEEERRISPWIVVQSLRHYTTRSP